MVQYAAGEILCHFDSDDWSDETRVESQIHFMLETKKAMVGYDKMFFVDEQKRLLWKYQGPLPIGTSLMYTREYWMRHPFPEHKHYGSDSVFAQDAFKTKDTAAVDAGNLMVARIHTSNTAPKPIQHRNNYRPADWSRLPAKFAPCLRLN